MEEILLSSHRPRAVQAADCANEQVADHFICKRPLQDERELREFCRRLENSTLHGVLGMCGLIKLITIGVYCMLIGSLEMGAQYFLLVIRNKSTSLTFLYVGVHSITFVMKVTNC